MASDNEAAASAADQQLELESSKQEAISPPPASSQQEIKSDEYRYLEAEQNGWDVPANGFGEDDTGSIDISAGGTKYMDPIADPFDADFKTPDQAVAGEAGGEVEKAEDDSGFGAMESSNGFDDDDDDDDDDFGDFGEAQSAPAPAPAPATYERKESTALKMRILKDEDFSSSETLESATMSITDGVFPNTRMIMATIDNLEDLPAVRPGTAVRTTRRGAEIWESLTKPRRSQVPDWKTSRTRRTYLVSLGMPVDLDQVLPTKQTQEKLVLSLKQKKRLSANAGGSKSTDGTASRALSSSDKPITPLSHANTAPLQPTHASAPVSRTGTPVAVPEFDVDRARQLSRVSVAALENMSTAELQSHVAELEQVKVDAAKYLAYWIDMRNTSEEDKAKYEGVIESSIEYAQRLRKHTTKQAALPRLSGLSRTKSLQNK